MSPTVRAAGGVLWRPAADSIENAAADGVQGVQGVEVALVRRERYDDWTLPKGKLEAGENELAAAVREVGEETGSSVVVGRRLPRVQYKVRAASKSVAYWSMRHCDGSFSATAEIDALQWLPVPEAHRRLSYRADRSVLGSFAAPPFPDGAVLLVRHAKAGKRSQWLGDDRDRPLEPEGRRQAARLARLLPAFGPSRVLSADLVRCRQTVAPLADELHLIVEDAPAFTDEASEKDFEGTLAALRSLAVPGMVSVVCSQGETIPRLMESLRPRSSGQTRKSAFWLLSFASADVVAADYYRP